MPLASDHRYTVISADCHGGANIADYRPYLESRVPRRLRRVDADFENPYDDVKGADADRNWDSDRRLAEMEADGVVAEVVFPNTIPPFFPKVVAGATSRRARRRRPRRRWAGIRAHNRWLADFCADAPGQRAGIARSCCTTSSGRSQEIRLGGRGRPDRRRPPARGTSRLRCSAAVRPRLRADLADLRGTGHAHQPPLGKCRSRLWRLPGKQR